MPAPAPASLSRMTTPIRRAIRFTTDRPASDLAALRTPR